MHLPFLLSHTKLRLFRGSLLLPPPHTTKVKENYSRRAEPFVIKLGETGARSNTPKQQEKDTTALEIATNDALFGQSGADEPWAWGDASNSNWHPGTSVPIINTARGNHNPRQTGGVKKKATGGDAPFDLRRGSQVAGMSHQLPRMKPNPNTGPHLHHLLERNNSLLTPPIGLPSPPPFETDHPLPDFNNWGFGGRNGSRNGAISTHFGNNNSNVSTIGGLSSPNGTSMFASVDSFLPDYDSTLYSLWNAPSTGSVMDYDTENDTPQDHEQQVQPSLYLAPDDELKMDYPQLTEFNQDLDSYLNDTMVSPTTPLGTSGMMKMDHLVTTDRKTGTGLGTSGMTTGTREPQLERLLAPAPNTANYASKRGRETAITPQHSLKRQRGYDDAYAVTPITSGPIAGFLPTSSGSTFRSVPKSTIIEPKRAIPSLGSFHNRPPPLPAPSSQARIAFTGNMTATSMVASTTSRSNAAAAKTGKRPRSRQCEFPGCQNRARSHQKCKKHGGAHQCVFEGCTKNSQSRGLCIAHGGGSRCKKEGCVRAAQSKGLCKSHGGGEFCAVEGCNKKAHLKHLCRTHGGGVRCKVDKCLKWAQRKGWCMAHAKEFSVT